MKVIIQSMASIGPGVSEEKLFENVDNTRTYAYIHVCTHTYMYVRTDDRDLPIP